MGIKILANTVWRDAARVVATDTSDVELSNQTALESITGGSRHLSYSGAGTSGVRLVYLNKSAGLDADHAVVIRADRHVGHSLAVRSWDTYRTLGNVLSSSSNFNPTLVGPTGQDFVLPFTLATNKQAFELELDSGSGGSYTKLVHQVFFSKAVEFLHQEGKPSFRKLRFPTRYEEPTTHKVYLADELVQITAGNVPNDTVRDFERLPWLKQEPLVIYDSTGKDIPYFALHGIIADYSAVQEFDDKYRVTMQILRLRHW